MFNKTKNDPYSTTIGSSYDKTPLLRDLEASVVTDDLDSRKENTLGLSRFNDLNPLFITGTYPSEARIPHFPHPILTPPIRGKLFICTDLRMTLRENKGGRFEERIKNRQEYDFMMNRHRLTTMWVGGKSSEFKTSLRFGAHSYAVWLSNALSHVKGIDPFQSLIVQAIFLCQYADMCSDPEEFKASDYRRSLVPWIGAIMRNSFKDLETIMEQIGNTPILSLEDSINTVKRILDTPLLNNLNAGIMVAIVKSHWFGQGIEPQKIIGVALEDPPTWCSLVKSAIDYTGYKNSMVAQTVLKLGKSGESESFSRSVSELLNGTVRMESTRLLESVMPDGDSFNFDYDQLVKDYNLGS